MLFFGSKVVAKSQSETAKVSYIMIILNCIQQKEEKQRKTNLTEACKEVKADSCHYLWFKSVVDETSNIFSFKFSNNFLLLDDFDHLLTHHLTCKYWGILIPDLFYFWTFLYSHRKNDCKKIGVLLHSFPYLLQKLFYKEYYFTEFESFPYL